jgi:hypothetical protein
MNDRISIIAAVMNRPDRVQPALDNWTQIQGIHEIILVDWSSTPAIPTTHPDPRVQIHRVQGEPRWQLTPAYNLAADIAQGDILLKLDIDYHLDPDFLSRTLMQPGQFRHGDWSIGQGTDDIHLSGFLMVNAADFRAAGRYNESITTYGQDDSELYQRLRKMGLEGVSITRLNGIRHIPHPDTDRHANQPAHIPATPPAPWRVNADCRTWTRHPDRTWTR